MLLFILAIIIGIGMGLFATQNTSVIPLNIGGFAWTDVPLYLVAFGFLLGGIIISAIFHMVDWFASIVTIHGKDKALRQTESTVQTLQDKVDTLEKENAALRTEHTPEVHEVHSEESVERQEPTFRERMRSMFGPRENPTI